MWLAARAGLRFLEDAYPSLVRESSSRIRESAGISALSCFGGPDTISFRLTDICLDAQSEPCWRIPAGQHFVFEDFEDGIVMFDALSGATHLLNSSAAETLAIVQESPGLTTAAIHRRLLERLEMKAEVLPFAALEELLWQLEHLNLIAAFTQ